PGDRILSINGHAVSDWEEIERQVYIENLGNDMTFEVDRSGRRTTLLSTAKGPATPADKPFGIVEAQLIPGIKAVDPKSAAEKVGLKAGDVIVAVESVQVGYPQVSDMIHERAGKQIALAWKRGKDTISGTTIVSGEGRIGILIEPTYTGPIRRIQYSILE